SWTGHARLWDAATGEPVSPWLKYSKDFDESPVHLSEGLTLFTRWPWKGNVLERECKFLVWDLRPDERTVEELETAARVFAGRRVDGEALTPLSPEEYRDAWQAVREKQPQLFAAAAPAVPEKLPEFPTPDPAPKPKPPPTPLRTADYAGLIRR